ncbi:serine/threonine protein kinase [Synechocystis sp. LEGE 06083]|nr:serine/threonine protein kinase [Synechocystis sp. LEGE 06083]
MESLPVLGVFFMVKTANVAVMPLFPRSQYRIIGQIGQGQFGRVYCAIHRLTGRMFALKDLEHRVFPTNKFLRELSYLLTLRHPNIVACHGLEYHPGGRYLVMDYCEGGTLRDIIDGDGDLCVAGKIDLVRQILLGLAQAHQHDIVHCDLKPENILLIPRGEGWQVKVSDFGIARLTAKTGNPNFGKGYTGSPAYMAPERFYGKFSVASDIYAVGILLYELIVGDRPFSGFPKALQTAHLNTRLTLPPEFPPLLGSIVQRALEKLPQRRFSSAASMASALATAQKQALEQSLTQANGYLYHHLAPASLTFTATVKHSTPLLFPVNHLTRAGLWLYLGNGTELYLWQYGDGNFEHHPLPRWSLGLPGTMANLEVNQDQISLLIQGGETGEWQFYQWRETLLRNLCLPKPCINLQADRLLANLSPGGKTLAVVVGDQNSAKGYFQVWRTDLCLAVAPALPTRCPCQLLTLDQNHGLLVQSPSTASHRQTVFFLFNRRGSVFPAFRLSFLVSQLVVNRYSRNHLFGLADDAPQAGILIRLQPLKVNRIALNVQPQFVQPFPWGYLLADRHGEVALLDYEGFLFGNFSLGETITAIAPMGRYLCLFATWQGNGGNLRLLDLGSQVENIIRQRQEKR